jgi:hypothetical protein
MEPVAATARRAAPVTMGYPALFSNGIAKDPVVTTFATGDPEMMAIRALLKIVAWAGPLLTFPVIEWANSTNNGPAPDLVRKAPQRT